MRETISLSIEGMRCERCVESIKNVLRPIPGVLAVRVTLDPACAEIEFDTLQCAIAQLRAAIENAGFDVR